jgi:hypothetical protein
MTKLVFVLSKPLKPSLIFVDSLGTTKVESLRVYHSKCRLLASLKGFPGPANWFNGLEGSVTKKQGLMMLTPDRRAGSG